MVMFESESDLLSAIAAIHLADCVPHEIWHYLADSDIRSQAGEAE